MELASFWQAMLYVAGFVLALGIVFAVFIVLLCIFDALPGWLQAIIVAIALWVAAALIVAEALERW